MSTSLTTLLRLLVLAALCLPLAVRAAGLDAATDKRLAELIAQAYDHPQASLKALSEWEAQKDPDLTDWLGYTRARIDLMQGHLEPAKAWAQKQRRQCRCAQRRHPVAQPESRWSGRRSRRRRSGRGRRIA